MRIIRDGMPDEDNKIKEFTCVYCGCVFEANKNEYKYIQRKCGKNDYVYYQCQCPYCGFFVESESESSFNDFTNNYSDDELMF